LIGPVNSVNQNLRGILFCGCLEKAGIADDYCPGLKMQGVILKKALTMTSGPIPAGSPMVNAIIGAESTVLTLIKD